MLGVNLSIGVPRVKKLRLQAAVAGFRPGMGSSTAGEGLFPKPEA
jgi:hypothetical protein